MDSELGERGNVGRCSQHRLRLLYHRRRRLRWRLRRTHELLQLTGLRNPYPGKLGVVQVGALADLLLVEGNPLKDVDLIADPERSFVVIMKDGVVVKNSIPQ